MATFTAVVVVVFGALAGAALGSYGAVAVSRGLRGSTQGRSQCDSCGRTLRWFELVPLLSWPALRGRCRTCGSRIGWTAWLWEVGGAAVASGAVIVLILAS